MYSMYVYVNGINKQNYKHFCNRIYRIKWFQFWNLQPITIILMVDDIIFSSSFFFLFVCLFPYTTILNRFFLSRFLDFKLFRMKM